MFEYNCAFYFKDKTGHGMGHKYTTERFKFNAIKTL